MEGKAAHAEEVEGPDFQGDPTAREAPTMGIREGVAALGEREVGGVWVVPERKPPPRPSIIGHEPPGAEIPAHRKFRPQGAEIPACMNCYSIDPKSPLKVDRQTS